MEIHSRLDRLRALLADPAPWVPATGVLVLAGLIAATATGQTQVLPALLLALALLPVAWFRTAARRFTAAYERHRVALVDFVAGLDQFAYNYEHDLDVEWSGWRDSGEAALERFAAYVAEHEIGHRPFRSIRERVERFFDTCHRKRVARPGWFWRWFERTNGRPGEEDRIFRILRMSALLSRAASPPGEPLAPREALYRETKDRKAAGQGMDQHPG